MNTIIKQLQSIIDKDLPLISNLSNASSVLNQLPNINWCGFYLVSGNRLILGPFQGDIACMHISRGRGVCGTAWEQDKTLVVPNVEQFPGHIACSQQSRSEIIVPLHDTKGKVTGVLDIDSIELNAFDEDDRQGLERLVVSF